MAYETFGVSGAHRKPLVDFMTDALEGAGCRILWRGPDDRAPFLITFETASGERMGILAYAFLATRTPTNNRPSDERSFQIKYGGKKNNHFHDLFQDPFGLVTTLLVGIDPAEGFFVGLDPVLRSPTRLFIRVEFKDEHAEAIMNTGWHAWERNRRQARSEGPDAEIVVGGKPERFLDYVRFERAAVALDQGHRQLLAEQWAVASDAHAARARGELMEPEIHRLEEEFGLSWRQVLDLIGSAPRLKTAVRGWVAEEHLVELLQGLDGVTACERIEIDGRPDVQLTFQGRQVSVECKNVLRKPGPAGVPRLDFQRTRASKADPCSRYYRPEEFDLVAACLHPISERWEFRFKRPIELSPHRACDGRLAPIQPVSDWATDPIVALVEVTS